MFFERNSFARASRYVSINAPWMLQLKGEKTSGVSVKELVKNKLHKLKER